MMTGKRRIPDNYLREIIMRLARGVSQTNRTDDQILDLLNVRHTIGEREKRLDLIEVNRMFIGHSLNMLSLQLPADS